MEICPSCGNLIAVDEHHLQDCIVSVSGSLSYLPDRYKRWKGSLDNYRQEWSFLPWTLRQRVSEQLMSFDYLWTLQEWLAPTQTIYKRQKVLAVTTIASVYEGVLLDIVEKIVSKHSEQDQLFDEIRYKPRYGYTFQQTLDILKAAGILSDDWYEYIGKLKSIRNWIHLGQSEQTQLLSWLDGTSYLELTNKLEEFKRIAMDYYQEEQ